MLVAKILAQASVFMHANQSSMDRGKDHVVSSSTANGLQVRGVANETANHTNSKPATFSTITATLPPVTITVTLSEVPTAAGKTATDTSTDSDWASSFTQGSSTACNTPNAVSLQSPSCTTHTVYTTTFTTTTLSSSITAAAGTNSTTTSSPLISPTFSFYPGETPATSTVVTSSIQNNDGAVVSTISLGSAAQPTAFNPLGPIMKALKW